MVKKINTMYEYLLVFGLGIIGFTIIYVDPPKFKEQNFYIDYEGDLIFL